jgi:hypothetical protein
VSLVLDLPTVLGNINTLSGTIAGIRHAYGYADWPSRPPGLPNTGEAYHLTGLPGTDGTSIRYNTVGMDLSEYILEVPLYTLVAQGDVINRAVGWIGTYFSGYPELFRDHIFLSGALTAGGAYLEQPGTIVRSLGPAWPGYDGFVILRWVLTVHIKGQHTNAP